MRSFTTQSGPARREFFRPAAWLVLLLMPLSLCGAEVNKTVIESGRKATALIEIRDGKLLRGWATAFCIDKSGVFVTNSHVAKTGTKDNKLTLVIDAGLHTQRSLTATVLKADADTDLAILRADHAGPYDSLELSDPASIRGLTETTQVTVFGYPFGEALALRDDARPEASVTSSRIMALRHDHGELQLIQLDGSINHGNSGGPVVNERGKVIGIISAGIPGSAIAFAIPANRVGHLLVAARVTLTPRSAGDAAAVFSEVLNNDESQPTDQASRATVPDDAARKAAQKVVHDLLAGEFADSTPKGKRALAAALLAHGIDTTDDPAGCYELLSEACDAAVDSEDLDTAMKAADELGRRYDINSPAQKAGILTGLAPRLTSPSDSALLAAHGLVAAQAMVHRDMYADAQTLIPIIRKAATASYSLQVQNQVRDKLVWVESACAQYTLAKPAIDKLKSAPNDPDANLTVGRFQCFARNDFEKGLPLLARGSDAALKAAAAADLAKPSTGTACKLAGDAWWDQAARETKDTVAADQCKARAGYWYRLGVAQLDGLAKALVEKRLASLPDPATDKGLPPAARPRRVDLFKLFDPATSIVKGVCRMEDGSLVVEPADGGRLFFPYQPPEEYDYRISFTDVRVSGDGICQMCYCSGRQFMFVLGGWGNSTSWFDMVNGLGADGNKTTTRKQRLLASGQHYVCVVKVRKTGVEAYLDGQLVTSLKTDYSDLSLNETWRFPRGDVVGLSAHKDTVRFDAAEIIEITGEGKLLSK